MAISEKITLLGKGLYKDIPDVLTLNGLPTASELDYVGGDDFQATMLDKILPKAISEEINFRDLLEIDFHWICRCLRILNYGPYHTTNAIYCDSCGEVSRGEYQVDLRTVDVKVLPEGFTNSVVVPKNEFIEFNEDITLKLPTIQEMINAQNDSLFKDANGDTNLAFARLCYMVKSIGNDSKLAIPAVKYTLQNKLISADFRILKDVAAELTDFGLRAGGSTTCPNCHSKEAAYIAIVDDRFFRPTLGNLRSWKADRDAQKSGESSNGINQGTGRVENLFPDATGTI